MAPEYAIDFENEHFGGYSEASLKSF